MWPDGKFVQPAGEGDAVPMIDCEGRYLAPGIIDTHVHLVWDGRLP